MANVREYDPFSPHGDEAPAEPEPSPTPPVSDTPPEVAAALDKLARRKKK